MNELLEMTATEAVDRLTRREIAPIDLVRAAYERIDDVDGLVNAVPTHCQERAEAQAKALETAKAPDDVPAWLAGLPMTVKDLEDVAGVRTTYGSPIFADHVPERSDIEVERLEARGAITLGKSNTPEFGAGANTFNEVFGRTLNPYNTGMTCAGSSGGAAVALATGMCWVATGSDLGGSLRTPASFCNVVGFRPSPGIVARSNPTGGWSQLSVRGPMARTAEDVALFLDAMSGAHAEDPISRDAPAVPYLKACRDGAPPRRVAFSEDLGGVSPVDAEVAAICRQAAKRFEAMGARVEEAHPDLTDALEAFKVLRGAEFVQGMADLYETKRDLLKPEVIWNIEMGMELTAERIAWANLRREGYYREMLKLFETHELLVSPTAMVPPFPVEERYLAAFEGVRFDSYIDWLALQAAITLTGCPAISMPAGFTEGGLPVGIQLTGRPRGEAELLGFARHFEAEMGHISRKPIDPRPPA